MSHRKSNSASLAGLSGIHFEPTIIGSARLFKLVQKHHIGMVDKNQIVTSSILDAWRLEHESGYSILC